MTGWDELRDKAPLSRWIVMRDVTRSHMAAQTTCTRTRCGLDVSRLVGGKPHTLIAARVARESDPPPCADCANAVVASR